MTPTDPEVHADLQTRIMEKLREYQVARDESDLVRADRAFRQYCELCEQDMAEKAA